MNKKFLKKIIAHSPEDLKLISACCSEGKVKISELKYLPKNKIFLVFINRIVKEIENKKDRVNSIIKFEYIYSSKSKNINQKNMDLTLELIAIDLYKKDIKIVDLTKSKIIDNKKHSGFLKSRILYIYIILISIVPLFRLLKKNPPDFFIAQLITSLPLFLNYIMKFKTKFILRISGLPKLNLIRHFFWKLSVKNVYALTCPTNETKNYLSEKNL